MDDSNQPPGIPSQRPTHQPPARCEQAEPKDAGADADAQAAAPDTSVPPGPLPVIGQFGPYEILGRLAMGGMAEILLARESVRGGGTRYLVVKRILQQYNEDDQFIQMFLDEARVAMRLSHPNICHIYQFGEHGGSYFIAMEWVNGVQLGKLIRRARDAGGVPAPIACRVVAQIAEALDHAHAAKDEDGESLGLIHRDVSPHNIMVSYDGAVKLLDFGIAKAKTQSHKTETGAVKGKFAYMAPEQVRTQDFDRRVDVFALGIVLYETLTGRALYRRETEFETMKAIVDEPVPSAAALRRQVPEELDTIAQRALQKHPADRFQTAGEMQEALETYLARNQYVVNAGRVAALMHKLFREEMKQGPTVDTAPFGSSYHLQGPELGQGFGEQPAPQRGQGAAGPSGDDAPTVARGARRDEGGTRTLDWGDGEMTFELHSPQEQLDVGGAPAATAGSGELELELDDRSVRPAAGPAPTAPAPSPATAVRGRRGSGGGGAGKLVATVAAIAVVGGGGFAAWHFGLVDRLTGAGGEPAPERATKAATAEAPSTATTGQTATLAVVSVPEGATVTVGERTYGTTPVSVEELDPGIRDVVVSLEGYHPWQQEVELEAGELQSVTAQLEKAPNAEAGTGRLTLETEPRAEVFIGNQSLGTTPLDAEEVPAGVLRLTFELPGGDEVKRAVFVPKDRETRTAIDLTR